MTKPPANVYIWVSVTITVTPPEGEAFRINSQASGTVDSDTNLLPEDTSVTTVAEAYAMAAIELASRDYAAKTSHMPLPEDIAPKVLDKLKVIDDPKEIFDVKEYNDHD